MPKFIIGMKVENVKSTLTEEDSKRIEHIVIGALFEEDERIRKGLIRLLNRDCEPFPVNRAIIIGEKVILTLQKTPIEEGYVYLCDIPQKYAGRIPYDL